MSDSDESFESADEGSNEGVAKKLKQQTEANKAENEKTTESVQIQQNKAENEKIPESVQISKSDQDIIQVSDNVKETLTKASEESDEGKCLDNVKTEIASESKLEIETLSLGHTSNLQNEEDYEKSNILVSDSTNMDKNKETDSEIAKGPEKEQQKYEEPKKVLDKLVDDGKQKSGWGWGSWGNSATSWGSSLLQTASTSVSTFTSSVGEGFSNVMETVESTLGAPDPQELAKGNTEDTVPAERAAKKPKSDNDEDVNKSVDPKEGPGGQNITRDPGDPHVLIDDSEQDAGWFSTFGVSTLTGAVKHTVQQTSTLVQEKSKDLVHGSLDVLETLGKKTYDVIAEGDHGIKKTIEKAKEKPNLSQLLREAADEADESAKREQEFVESRKSHFGAQFDDFQGLVQLEALEMLSNQCESKLHNLLSALTTEQLAILKPQLVSIKESFELGDLEEEEEDEHNFGELVTEYTGQLALNITAAKLIQVHEKCRQWLTDCIEKQEESACNHTTKEIHEKAIQSLAEVTARTIEHFHRLGQLLLVKPQGPVTAYKDKATAIGSLTKCMCSEVTILSTKFTQSLTASQGKDEAGDAVNALITNVYLEAGNSSNYIQNAFQLLLPVIQQAATEASTTAS